MNAPASLPASAIPALGEFLPEQGGFFAGTVNIGGVVYGLASAPKEGGELEESPWNDSYAHVAGATSFNDGLANTKAMAEAGSELAKQALAANINGKQDWYIPAVDELEIAYRAFKPTDDDNSGWNRSGINVSAVPPTQPYTMQPVAQTTVEAFQKGGAEAFESDYYWTSTQHAYYASCAWQQRFSHGSQLSNFKEDVVRARLFRRFVI
jgi:hypothetical protein